MTISPVTRLRLNGKRLHALDHSRHSPTGAHELTGILAITIKDLRELYPDDLSSPQRHQLLQNVALLERQQQVILATPSFLNDQTSWQAVQQTLILSIETTLADEATANG